jgi:hypothetical protein
VVDENKEAAEEFEIIEQPGDGSAPPEPEPKVEDERLRSDDEDEDDDSASGGSDETPEQRAERRRDERRKRRERQRKAEYENKASLQRANEQIEVMASKMQQMEALQLRNEARAVEERMEYARNTYSRAERAHSEAVARGDGIGASNALRVRDQAADEYRQSQGLQARLMQFGQEPGQRQQAQPRGPDPRVVQRARSFVEKHPWIDPSGLKDEDSAVARALDMKLQADGYDPGSDEYWTVLEKTLEKRLPHRFKPAGRSSPPTLGGMDRAGSGKRTFYISPERKKALQETGDWDDISRRNKMVKAFADYDAKNKSTAAR